MTYVQTVLGPIDPDKLGFTLPHEHIICDSLLCRSRANMKKPQWGTYMWFDDPEVMTKELKLYREDGGGAIVDVTCHGWGRDPIALRKISVESQVHIVACTGFYVENCMPDWVKYMTVDRLASWIEKQILTGCNARQSDEITDVKAGIIKTSVSRSTYSHLELKGLKAVAKAHLRTGIPITTHNSGSIRYEIEGGNIGTELLEFMEDEGVNPESIIIGHTDENPDIRNLVSLARKGVWIQFDTIGKQNYILDETRAALVLAFKNRGLLNQLLLSQDRNRKPMLRKYGGPGYSDVINRFKPMLERFGLTHEEIIRVTHVNPAKALRKREK